MQPWKRNGVLKHTTTWKNPENVMHGEKCPHVVIPFIHKAQNRQRQRDRKPVHGCQARGVGEQGVVGGDDKAGMRFPLLPKATERLKKSENSKGEVAILQ